VVRVKPWVARVVAASCAAVAVLAAVAAVASAATGARATPATSGRAAPAARGPARRTAPVIVIGISGLRWTDISPSQTPALWRLAERGSVGSLVVSGARTLTCPADAWLTLNAGASAVATAGPATPCPGLPAVVPSAPARDSATARAAARVPAMTDIESFNRPYSQSPCWGVLANAYTPGGACPGQSPASYPGCATAIGPGAALALSGAAGEVQGYAASAGDASRSLLSRCRLTVVDLGRLPAGGTNSAVPARAGAMRAADRAAGRIIGAAPPGATIVVAGLGDDSAPHLHAIIVSGPGFGPGLLRSASTRQPGLVLSTDLTPTILRWLRRSNAGLVGSVITNSARGPLAGAIAMLTGQDTAAQVYRLTAGWFFLVYGAAEAIAAALIALLLRGQDAARTRRRLAAYRNAMVSAAAVPAGTILAGLVPWPVQPHPALVLYGVALAWAAVIATAALVGPWRRDPLGAAGFVSAVTVAIIAGAVVTGSRLQLDTPFGLSVLESGRWYGIGNNTLGVYAAAGLICAAWAGVAGLRAGSRPRAVAAAAAIAALVLLVCAIPAFGAKVGGTVALTPAFLLLLAAIGGVRITPPRVALIAVSGLVVITGFAVLSYLFPAVGVSDIGAFVGHVLHGTAGPILDRKASANLSSVTQTWFTPVVPVLVAVAGLMLVWPERLRLRVLARAFAAEPLLRPLLTSIWVAGVLGWLADDSGVRVPAAMLPLALPLALVIITQIGEGGRPGDAEGRAAANRAGFEGPVQAPGRHG
jgi:hypothetical protein